MEEIKKEMPKRQTTVKKLKATGEASAYQKEWFQGLKARVEAGEDFGYLNADVPMEILNFIPDVRFKKAIGVLTEMKAITFADEAIRLGADFMDAYEEPSIHRQNEYI